MRDLVRKAVINLWRFLSAAALIVCIIVAMFVIIEIGFRIKDKIAPPSSARAEAVRDPRFALPWYRRYYAENNASRFTHWQPYVYFRRNPSFKGQYVNIDTAGRRITPQPTTPAVPSARVFFLGGSTMWGTSQRDSFTIPAEASRRLQALAGPGKRVEVTNFGTTGYVFTQEIIELMLELRNGNVPDVVVFYDGINDALATMQNGRAGIPQNENKRVSEFSLGRTLDPAEQERTFRSDLHVFRVLAQAGLPRLHFYNALMSLKPPAAAGPLISADSAARGTVLVYRRNIDVVEALARQYGFTTIYVWQPTLHNTSKRLTPYEDQLIKGLLADPFQKRLKESHVLIRAMVDSAMANVVPGRFINASSLFKGDTTHIYVDRIGHTSETAIPTIVDSFWTALSKAVGARLAIKTGSR